MINEKQIFKLLGVNQFRRYCLSAYEKLINKFIKFDSYRINDYSDEGLVEFRDKSNRLMKIHINQFIFFVMADGIIIIMGIVVIPFLILGIIEILIDFYCIMANRQHVIRIDVILTKRAELKSRESFNNKSPNEITIYEANTISNKKTNSKSLKLIKKNR